MHALQPSVPLSISGCAPLPQDARLPLVQLPRQHRRSIVDSITTSVIPSDIPAEATETAASAMNAARSTCTTSSPAPSPNSGDSSLTSMRPIAQRPSVATHPRHRPPSPSFPPLDCHSCPHHRHSCPSPSFRRRPESSRRRKAPQTGRKPHLPNPGAHIIPAKAGTYPHAAVIARAHPSPSSPVPSFPRRRESRPIGRGAQRAPSPQSSTPHVIPAKAGTYWERPSAKAETYPSRPPRAQRRLVPPSAQKRPMQRPKAPYAAPKRRSKSAHGRPPPSGLPPAAPEPTREPNVRSLTPRQTKPLPAFP